MSFMLHVLFRYSAAHYKLHACPTKIPSFMLHSRYLFVFLLLLSMLKSALFSLSTMSYQPYCATWELHLKKK
jgi:hypothetical protein